MKSSFDYLHGLYSFEELGHGNSHCDASSGISSEGDLLAFKGFGFIKLEKSEISPFECTVDLVDVVVLTVDADKVVAGRT